jgi:hypothetical protein
MNQNVIASTVYSMSQPFTWNDVRDEINRRTSSKSDVSDLDIELFLQSLLLQGLLLRRDWKFTFSDLSKST